MWHSKDVPLKLDDYLSKVKEILNYKWNNVCLFYDTIEHNWKIPSFNVKYAFHISGHLSVMISNHDIVLMDKNDYFNFGIKYLCDPKYNPDFFTVNINDLNYKH